MHQIYRPYEIELFTTRLINASVSYSYYAKLFKALRITIHD